MFVKSFSFMPFDNSLFLCKFFDWLTKLTLWLLKSRVAEVFGFSTGCVNAAYFVACGEISLDMPK